MNTTQSRPDAPRQHTDMYGEPIASHATADEYWEAYNPSNWEPNDPAYETDTESTIYVFHYILKGGEWVQTGLDQPDVQDLFEPRGKLR